MSFQWSSLFGDSLHVKGSDGKVADVSTDSHLANKIVMIYFSAHWCPPCRGFTPSLCDFYKKLQMNTQVPFEIVFASSDQDENAFNEYYGEMPFASLPYANRAAKDKLSSSFGVSGIPTLVVLDTDGSTISKKGRNLVASDSDGVRFPWKPLSMAEELGDEFVGKDDGVVSRSSFAGKYVGIYFSAHWCPPCRQFTPKLVNFYNKRKEQGHNDFEIIFASSDKDKDQYDEYYGEMPWLALPFQDKRKDALSERFNVDGIPFFVILDPELNVVTTSARNSIMSDPEGTKFPFYPEPMQNLSEGGESFGFDLNSKTALLVLMENSDDSDQDDAKAAMLPFATRLAKDKVNTPGGPELLFFYSFEPSSVSAQVRKLCKLPPAEKAEDPAMVLLDIPDRGGYYMSDATEITSESIETFLNKFKAGSLERKQLSP